MAYTHGAHRLSEIDVEQRLAVCDKCGPTKIRRKGVTRAGLQRWRCTYSDLADYRRRYRVHVGDVCERCGFVPEHVSQLDVHHDGGKQSEVYKTLCANCHRLVTYCELHDLPVSEYVAPG